MKKALLLLSSLSLIFGCDNSSNQSSQIDEGRPIEMPDFVSFALQPTSNSWPKDLSIEGLSENLLTANYYMVLDGSGSMADSNCSGNKDKLSVAKTAIAAFTQQIPSSANLGLLAFDEKGIYERVSLAKNNREQFQYALKNIVANKGTPLNSAMRMAYESLYAQAKRQLGYGEYHLIVVTDGEANRGEDPSTTVVQILSDSPVQIHTIGFCIEGGHSLNQPGKISYKQANDPTSLAQSLKEVLAESPNFDSKNFEG